MNYDFTQAINNVYDDYLSDLTSFYCKEDYQSALDEIMNAAEDNIWFKIEVLQNLLSARGISGAEYGIPDTHDKNFKKDNIDTSFLNDIPERKKLRSSLPEMLFKVYNEIPTASDYITRLVTRMDSELLSGENVSSKTAILRKFIMETDNKFNRFDINSILSSVEKTLSEEDTCKYNLLKTEREKRKYLAYKINDDIFKANGTEENSAITNTLIFQLIEKYNSKFIKEYDFNGLKLSRETEKQALTILNSVKDAENSDNISFKQISETIDKKTDEKIDLLKNEDEFIKLLEKDFRNQTKEIEYQKKNGKTGTLNGIYDEAKRSLRKKMASKNSTVDQELLKMCSDLSDGKFRVNGKTRIYLYYFAIIFNMTFSLSKNELINNSETDIVKNLFYDYYGDNLKRYFSEGDTTLEREPTGEGINYKNFAEVIYLYFIYRKDLQLTPGEKIDKAEEFINLCVNDERNYTKAQRNDNLTVFYKELCENELFEMQIDEIVDYVVENFPINGNMNSSRIMIASEERTAQVLLQEIVNDLDEQNAAYFITEEPAEDQELRQTIFFNDTDFKNEIVEKYGKDESCKEFLETIERISTSLNRETKVFNHNNKLRLLAVLRILAEKSDKPIPSYQLKQDLEQIRNIKIVSAGKQISNSIKILISLGYGIETLKNNNTNYYTLKTKEYSDNDLNELIRKVKHSIDDSAEKYLEDMLIKQLTDSRKITRTELIGIHLSLYESLLEDSESDGFGLINSCVDLMEDYKSLIDNILIDARYQPLSTKNIFDTYVITSLYYNLINNR